MARLDPHSYNDDSHAATESLAWTARVDFATRTLHAKAVLTFRAPGEGPLDLDTRDLTIESITDPTGATLHYTLHPADAVLGARLTVILPAGTDAIRIRYRTSPGASALQWLEPAQTAGGVQPYLFSQCQAIHARSVVPLQDTPRLRIRYTAELTVPRTLRAVMAAAHLGRAEEGDVAVERFEMPQPIPPYLLAFAVGDLASRDLSPRSRVWAEPTMLERAAWEFAGVEKMIEAAEAMFGPYDWERFDILTMPPSFPYGGMENPRLTFLTPTLIAGDRSLVSVLAHELAHSWTGNLVTNANAEHFWLNEGFTVYAEVRIIEATEGAEMASLHAAIGRRELDEAIQAFKNRPQMTRLRTHLLGVDPDDTYSQVPYQKGFFFLRTIEHAVGREAFTKWLQSYLRAFRFEAITTDDFIAHLERELPGTLAKVDGMQWIDGEGVPANAPRPQSARLEVIERLGKTVPSAEVAAAWSPTEWQLYLDAMPRPALATTCATLDETFKLTASTNYEVLVAWLTLALQSGYHRVVPRVEQVLGDVGRMKYVKPLYAALARDPQTKATAQSAFARYRDGYHPIARQVIEGILRS
ncbi:MAG: M1 family metallopeptidase [Kofleriaceae bacterium]|nr:M1 family metallopeptidase [Kofleriaceae bacterium]